MGISSQLEQAVDKSIDFARMLRRKLILYKLCRSMELGVNFTNYSTTLKWLYDETFQKETHPGTVFPLYFSSIRGRLQSLSDEFVDCMLRGNHFAAIGLLRYVTDMYLRTVYVRYNPQLAKNFIDFDFVGKDFPGANRIVELLNSQKISFPYVKFPDQYTAQEFLKSRYQKFVYLSEMIHPTARSFSSNIFILRETKDGGVILPFKEKNIKEGDKVATLSGGSTFPLKYLRNLVQDYFWHVSAILADLDIQSVSQSARSKDNSRQPLYTDA